MFINLAATVTSVRLLRSVHVIFRLQHQLIGTFCGICVELRLGQNLLLVKS